MNTVYEPTRGEDLDSAVASAVDQGYKLLAHQDNVYVVLKRNGFYHRSEALPFSYLEIMEVAVTQHDVDLIASGAIRRKMFRVDMMENA